MKYFPVIYLCLIFYLFLLPVSIFSQQPNLHFYHLTTADGLSDNSVNDICQDHEGFLWFATRNGLNRYDGKHFVVFRHSFFDSSSINNNLILHIVADNDDNIWFAASYSISCLDRQTGKFINYYYKKNDGSIVTTPQLFNAIAILPSGGVIAFSTFYGFFLIDKSSGKLIRKKFSQIPAGIPFMNQFLTSTGWIGYKTDSSFYASGDNGKHFQCLLQKENIPADIPALYFRMVTTKGSTCCLATVIADKPTIIITIDTLTKERHTATLSSKIMLPMNKYDENIYWMGFWGEGLIEYNSSNGKTISYYHADKDDNTLSSDLVRTMFTDKDKNIWIGTEEGINYCNPEKDNAYTINNNVAGFENMHINSVETMAEDSTGKIWIGMLNYNAGAKSGLTCFDPSAFKYENFLEEGNPYDGIWKILPENNGNILLSTQMGLYQFNQQTKSLNRNFKCALPKEVINFNKGITILQKDTKGNYWFGLWRKGLIKYNPSTNQSIYFSSHAANPDLKLDEDLVASLAEDDKGEIWVIKWTNSVIECIDNNTDKVTHIPLEINGQVFTDRLENMLADHNGHIWIGTSGGGLIRIDIATRKVKLFSINDGLPDENIRALSLDKSNRLWVYSSMGLVWIDAVQGSVHAIDDNIFKFSDSYSNQAMLISKEGNMYISNRQNLFLFDPDDIVLQQQVKLPVLTAIHKFGQTFYAMPLQKEIKILPGEDFLRFDFVSIDMRHGRQINYAYRLKGYDEKWQDLGNEGTAIFTKLPPGDYELQMRASFQGMAWDGKYTSVSLKVIPAFYQAFWFRILVLLSIFSLLAYFVYYLSTRKLREKLFLLKQEQRINSLRNRIAADLHDDIGSTLNSISVYSEVASQQLRNDTNNARTLLEKMGNASRDMIDTMNDIVWAVNPKNDQFENILQRMKYFAGELLSGKNILLRFDTEEKIKNIKLPMEKRKNFYLIFKEAINNVYKYSDSKSVNVSIALQADCLMMTIIDDGIGFNIDKENENGNGLKNMRGRAAEINAELNIKSEAQKGTMVELRVPVK